MRRRFMVNNGKDIINNYLTIEALEDGLTAKLSTNAVEYCVDGDGNWKTLAANTNTPSINKGQTLSFRGNLTPNGSNGIGAFTLSYKKCNLKGNVMSMLFGDNAADNFSLSGKNYAFYQLFRNCYHIIDASNLSLPAITLASNCYSAMFYGCTGLTTAPKLPATTMVDSCYSAMFKDCTSLTTAPELSAATLAFGCYNEMFRGCSSLTVAPDLPATSLANYCYYGMFNGCSSLVIVPSILPATTLSNNCYDRMFYGCSSLVTAPELPATSLVYQCYVYMFCNCSKLNYIKALALGTNLTQYMNQWVYGVAKSGTFIKHKNATWNTTGANGVPSGWTIIKE